MADREVGRAIFHLDLDPTSFNRALQKSKSDLDAYVRAANQALGGINWPSPGGGGGFPGGGGSGGGRSQQPSNLLAQLERQQASAQVGLAKVGGDRELQRIAALQQEIIRHQQTINKIARSPFSPDDARRAHDLANAINKINVERINQQFSQLDRQLDKTNAKLSSFIQGLGQGLGIAVFNQTVNAATGALNAMGSALTGSIKGAAQFEQLNVAFTTILGSSSKAKQALEDLVQFAATTPFELLNVQESARALLAYGFSAENLESTLRDVGNVAAGVGAPLEELSAIYGKIRTNNQVFAEDLNQLTGRGIPIIKVLAEQFGVAEEEIRKMTENGQIHFADIERAFKSMSGEGGQFFNLMEAQSKTSAGLFSNLMDRMTIASRDFGVRLDPVVKGLLGLFSGVLGEAGAQITRLDDLSEASKRLGDALSGNPDLMRALGGALADVADTGLSVLIDGMDYLDDLIQNQPQKVEAMAQSFADLAEVLRGVVVVMQELVDLFLDANLAADDLADWIEGIVGTKIGTPGDLFRNPLGSREDTLKSISGNSSPSSLGRFRDGKNFIEGSNGISGRLLDSASEDVKKASEEASKELERLAKEAEDFYRGIAETAEDLQFDRLDAQIQTQMAETKAKLIRATNSYDTILGDFASSFESLFDLLGERMTDQIDVQRQIMESQRQFSGISRTGASLASQAYSLQNPDGTAIKTLSDVNPHHSYQSVAGRNVYDVTAVDSNNSDRVSIPSPFSGTVASVNNDPGGYGNWVELRDPDGAIARLAHFAEVLVRTGDQIVEGQAVGIQGSTGQSSGVHLHAELPPQYAESYIRRLTQGGSGGALLPPQGSGGGGGDRIQQGVNMALPFLRQEEGFSATPYWDVNGYAIGYGDHKLAETNTTVTEAQAAEALSQRLVQDYLLPALDMIPNQVRQQLTPGQIAAIASFSYNAGTGGFAESQFGQAVMAGDLAGASRVLPSTYTNGGVLSGRRLGEQALFNSQGSGGASGGVDSSAARGQIDAGLRQNTLNQQQSLANIQQQARAAGVIRQAEIDRAQREARYKAEQTTRDLEQSRIERQNSRDEYASRLGDDRPSQQHAEALRQIEADSRDRIRQIQDDIRELTIARESAMEYLKIAQESGSPEAATLIPGLQEIIRNTETGLDQSRSLLAEYEKLGNDIYAQEQERFQRAEGQRRFSARQGILGLETGYLSQQSQIEDLRNSGRSRFGIAPSSEGIFARSEASRSAATAEFEAANRAIEEERRLEALTAEEMKRKLELTRDLHDQKLEIIDLTEREALEEQRISEIARARNLRERHFSLSQSTGEAQRDRLRMFGLSTDASRGDRDSQISALRNDTANRLDDLNNSGLPTEEIQSLGDEITRLGELKIDNVLTQFSTLGQLMPSLQDSFSQFASTTILDFSNIGQAASTMLSSIANSMANLAAQMLTAELFKMIFGDGLGAVLGTGGSSFLGDAISLPIAADGGIVGQIGKAAMRERAASGYRPRLIMANENELILSADKSKDFFELGLDNILGMAKGGMVGGSRPGGRAAFGGGDVVINPVFNLESADDAQILANPKVQKILMDRMKSVTVQTLNEQRRPAGSLRRSR